MTNIFMIDIETGGLAPGAAILEVAAAEFDPASGEILREWSAQLDLLDSMRLGLTMDRETAAFHLRTGYPGDLRGGTVWRVMNALDVFLHANSEEITVWAWGKDFEAKHFEHVLGVVGLSALWDFRRLHCARDKWMEAFGQDKPRKRTHQAAQDVRDQVADLAAALSVTSTLPRN
jgi:hypothetical protein